MESGQESFHQGPVITLTLGNRPRNNTARLYLPTLVVVLPTNKGTSIQLFLITLDRVDKSPGPNFEEQDKIWGKTYPCELVVTSW